MAVRALLILFAACFALPARAAERVTIFAAASLAEAVDALAPLFRAKGLELRASYASSSLLARQIEQGASADLFISADLESMARVEATKQAKETAPLLGNALAVVAPATSPLTELPLTVAAIEAALGTNGRLAIGDPEAVPAGRYAMQAFGTLKLDALKPRLAGAVNVRAALTFVARGEAPLGIVYATDAAAEPRVKIVSRFPETSHQAIVYPAARLSDRPPARIAYEILRSPEAAALFRKAGFRPPP